jgi:hypothetical protein
MPRPRIAMRKIREVLRLVLGEGLSRHRAAAATGVPYTTVTDCLSRATGAGLQWPLPEGMDDRDLEARLYRRALPPTGETPPLGHLLGQHRPRYCSHQRPELAR